jgi:hypothetical protein
MTTGKKIALSLLVLTGVGAAYYFMRNSGGAASLLPSGGSGGSGTNLPSGGSGTASGKYPAGTLLRTNDRSAEKNKRVYIIGSDGKRYYISALPAGKSNADVISISLAALEAIPDGGTLSGINFGSLAYSMN